jgi:hypothetical protein
MLADVPLILSISRHVAEFHDLPMLRRFPYPVQTLIQSELRRLDDELRELNDDVTCGCIFYRKWYNIATSHVWPLIRLLCTCQTTRRHSCCPLYSR